MAAEQIERRIRYIALYAVGSTLAFMAMGVIAFSSPANGRFKEIDVERINIVEPDGRPAVVIANEASLPGNVMDGREYSDRTGMSGLIFYNSEGDESGGLINGSARHDDGSFRSAFGQLSLDRFESDQVVSVRYLERPGYRSAGVHVSDFPRSSLPPWAASVDSINRLPATERPAAMRDLRQRYYLEGKWEVQRLFIGQQNETVTVDLRDSRGQTRLRLLVDSLDVPRLEFLDDQGEIIYRLPSEAGRN